ncbi:MAG: hypothetical protein LPJ92_05370 [Rhodobacterales bacterium]|nr:hypothetical protein [Rhodobacterales bacterium]MDX5389744.1 hypothetical protein [Rhodobacterales bacterium]MDX5489441.1 hypothetical protein [Rhodobacterales bacterium]
MRASDTDKDHPRPAPPKTAPAHRRRGPQRGECLALALLAVVMTGGWLLALHG